MFLAILFCLAVPRLALAWPVGAWADTAMGFDLTTDYLDGYYGPWSSDYFRSSRWTPPPGFRGMWPFDRYGFGDPLDYLNPLSMGYDTFARTPDYMYYGPYPKTVDFNKEKYVRDYPFGDTEVGVRDSMTVRPGGFRSPLSRALPPYLPRPGFRPMDRQFYPYLNDNDLAMPPSYRRMFASGLGTPRPSSLRTGGDFMFMKR